MYKKIRLWMWRISALGMGGWMMQAGCIQQLQQELEVLFRVQSSPQLIHQSYLVDIFGAAILGLFNS